MRVFNSPNLQEIQDDFVKARDANDKRAKDCLCEIFSRGEDPKERDPLRLYATDVGACPRAVAYRLLGAEKRPKEEWELRNNRDMYDQADYVERRLAAALLYADRLIDFQFRVDLGRENWGARGDIIADYHGQTGIEVKSARPNMFSHPLPKRHHVCQRTVYDEHTDIPFLIWYEDRAGSNTPHEYDDAISRDEMLSLMDALDAIRQAVVDFGEEMELPDRLPKVLEKRSYGKKLVYEPPWDCNYCDYAIRKPETKIYQPGGVCKVNWSTSVWAERKSKKHPWVTKPAANLDMFSEWAAVNA